MSENSESDQARDPRVYLAAERTLLAWIRTGLAMMGFGFIVARFGLFLRELAASQSIAAPRTYGLSLWIGAGLVVLGVVVNIASALHYRNYISALDRGQPQYSLNGFFGVVAAILLAGVGLAMTVYLIYHRP